MDDVGELGVDNVVDGLMTLGRVVEFHALDDDDIDDGDDDSEEADINVVACGLVRDGVTGSDGDDAIGSSDDDDKDDEDEENDAAGDAEVDNMVEELEGSAVLVCREDDTGKVVDDDDDDDVEGECVDKEVEAEMVWGGRVWVIAETDEERTGTEERLQVAQQVRLPAGLEQSSIVQPAALSPYSQPTRTISIITYTEINCVVVVQEQKLRGVTRVSGRRSNREYKTKTVTTY